MGCRLGDSVPEGQNAGRKNGYAGDDDVDRSKQSHSVVRFLSSTLIWAAADLDIERGKGRASQMIAATLGITQFTESTVRSFSNSGDILSVGAEGGIRGRQSVSKATGVAAGRGRGP